MPPGHTGDRGHTAPKAAVEENPLDIARAKEARIVQEAELEKGCAIPMLAHVQVFINMNRWWHGLGINYRILVSPLLLKLFTWNWQIVNPLPY